MFQLPLESHYLILRCGKKLDESLKIPECSRYHCFVGFSP